MRWYLRFAVGACFLIFAGQAAASPWAEPGDRQLRDDIEILAQYGLIKGPITTWPLPWAQISSRLSDDTDRPLPAYVRLAVERVRAKMPSTRDFGRPLIRAEARGTNHTGLARDFGNTARDKVDAKVSAEMNWSATSARISVGHIGDGSGGTTSFDGSYLAAALGNWVVYGGFLDQWWGPGWASSLIESTNSRPPPRVGLMRLNPKPFGTWLLRWLGPWQFNFFLGQLNDKERIVRNPFYMGFRFSFQPFNNFEIGLSRTMMLCGRGQRCDFNAWTNVLAGFNSLDNPKNGLRDSGNQLAGGDFRWGMRLTDTLGLTVYGQLIGEDSTYLFPYKLAGLAGASLDGPWGSKGAHWRTILEYTDTVASGLFRPEEYNIIYNHFRYKSGYHYHGLSMGDRFDSDSKAWSLTTLFTDTHNWAWRFNVQTANVNIDGKGVGLSSDRERINLVEAGVKAPSPYGDIDLTLRYQDDRPNTPGVKKGVAAIEVGWSYGF